MPPNPRSILSGPRPDPDPLGHGGATGADAGRRDPLARGPDGRVRPVGRLTGPYAREAVKNAGGIAAIRTFATPAAARRASTSGTV
jgi:hypothetical protein